MKKTIIILTFICAMLNYNFAQVGYVSVEDEIYNFLNRMNIIGVLKDYDEFEIPKSRNEIKKFLQIIVSNKNKLDDVDKNKLNDFLQEFEFDLSAQQTKSKNMFPGFNIKYLFHQNEKYLYSYSNVNGTSLFINFIGKIDYLSSNDIDHDQNSNSVLYRFGGEIRGSFFNNIGYEINTTNGSFFGNKSIAQEFSSLKYNYKFHRISEDNTGDNYFDETSAFLAYENNNASIKIGNDRKLIGHGNHKIFLSNNAPRMNYISLSLKYKLLNFSFFHGKLLGSQVENYDSIQGSINQVSDKYLVYHRIGLNFSRHLKIGVGEMIIYANRNVDLSYLNPINFYKSTEHANQDRDNSFLFIDLQNNTIDKLKFYSTILIDDIDFGKLGKGWYGNQTLITVGAYSNLLYGTLPLDFEFQYVKIDPYVYTHRINDNNFTNSNFSLGSTLKPNSSSTIISLIYRPYYRFNVRADFLFSIHGANSLNQNDELLINHGGDILVGHRPIDSEVIYFLKGEKEIYRTLSVKSTYEPIKNWIFTLNINFSNNSLSRSQQSQNLFTTFSLYTKL